MSDLKCQMPKCRAAIFAMTGLQELNKLIKHVGRCHGTLLNMNDALELRCQWESVHSPGCLFLSDGGECSCDRPSRNTPLYQRLLRANDLINRERAVNLRLKIRARATFGRFKRAPSVERLKTTRRIDGSP